MGIKGKAALAIVVLLFFLGSMWLQGSLDYQWDSCLKGYIQINSPRHLSNGSEADSDEDGAILEVCPGQKFQVSELLSHLLAALAPTNDVLLQPYLASWDELIKFMEALGPMVGLISQEIEAKTSIIRDLTLREAGSSDEGEVGLALGLVSGTRAHGGGQEETEASVAAPSSAYLSLRSMIHTELSRGLVDFQQTTESGCRTLLRLHRALLWLQVFLEKLGEGPVGGRLRSPSELCREAYQHTLAHHHSWFVRRAAEIAFIAMPERGFFYRLVCVTNQEEASVVLNRVVRAIGEVYDRTQGVLEEHGMLDLP
ncbi:glycolipid transfer protein domain-containing protein 2 [Salmo salar]|uniref:Glycolipid transfer protein domain-containing protein 2 n=1 Tax=Salmo salar TaxID=8030 RepID=A0A1S3RL03_SALSA|nr:glycolipid transfer protein domain-containing protein 2 [Salmo salar]|eukprot:XP_014052965.1 PREDICTED: ceramide-1-phosphate transfer protein-like [Salmo salar]